MNLRMGPGVPAVLCLGLCLACGQGKGDSPGEPAFRPDADAAVSREAGAVLAGGGAPGTPAVSLEELAEIERTGSFFQGLGLTESTIREDAGDYGGAVIAAYKELAWGYGYGGVSRDALAEGMDKVLNLYGEGNQRERDTARASRGILAFLEGRWDRAGELLAAFAGEEPDAFSRWMLLVCALEGGDAGSGTRSAYGAIRARYEKFPEYWFRGARTFPGALALEYAERCINLSPRGPFAEECRGILARGMGFPFSQGEAVKSRAEIEDIIYRAAESGRPELLAELFPLMALPDNAYTLYAVGALRALTAVPQFRDFFTGQSARSSGRLGERLAYISRG